MTRRYAIYFAPPPGSELETFGRRFLGRDHVSGEGVDQPAIEGFSTEDLKRVTKSARRYGFHATLKAPFVLKEGVTANDLYQAAIEFSAKRTAFEAPPLRIAALSRWLTFKLSTECSSMDQLAADCVGNFEPFRAPLTEADIARRREAGLTSRQDEQLLAFGYPYIFDDFRFHMTLAGPLAEDERERLLEAVRPMTAAIEEVPLRVDAIALYEQPDPDGPFVQTGRFPFMRK